MAKSGSQKRRREAEAIQEQAIASAAEVPGTTTAAPPTKKARVEERRSLFVRSLPPSATSETLTELFSQHFPVKHATVVLDQKTKTPRGYGFVTFTDAEDALQAKEKLDNHLIDGRRMRLEIAEPRHRAATKAGVAVETPLAAEKRKREEEEAEDRKPPKLIIRNLPWSIKTKDQLSALFQSYGKVRFSDLPNSKGKLSGFGFVTLRGRKNAEKAIEGLNGKEVDGRTIAVDWAVDKATWEKQQQNDDDSDTPKKAKTKEADAKANSKADQASTKTKSKGDDDFDEDEDLKNFFANQGDNLEDEDESDEDDDEDKKSDDEDDEDEEEGGANVNDDEEEEDAESAKKKAQTTDNSSTLFIRNLPFTTTDEQLKEHFAHFGAVRYARVVMDHATQKSAGKGFVCFFNTDDAESCLRAAPKYRPAPTLSKHSVLQDETVDMSGKYTLEGRILQVSKALSKGEAQQLTSEAAAARDSEEKDKRRLFLLNEGQIRPDSPIYNQLPQSEIQMREASAKQRKKMIESNPSLHLSLTRLAIRNIPRSMTSKDLKALARQAVVGFATDVKAGKRQPLSKEESRRAARTGKEAEHKRKLKRSGVVSQAKVVFESKDGSKVAEPRKGAPADAGAKSRGYGFIEYSSHRWALMGARWLNGHAVEGGTGKKATRLIVEFAIENANVVARRSAAQDRARGLARTDAAKPQLKTGDDSKIKDDATKTRSDRAQEEMLEGEGEKPSKSAGKKLAMRQQIIGRKRMMRKKKAEVRKGKR
ncbi:hypothetical protein PpBr36_00511 [Pyricularia pennisetigena]|uniref:hypothetical protein n=1 Tax=Pyricularia pennisetigena TaxID=1578925 RepID=UPI0011509587|nr:hypothetical protein PpBr36_00511 [Pyricularia pennisetigena]TLS27903.1 hypothetical protein PpBr36_00511 [Pyricularia pennisetigena]